MLSYLLLVDPKEYNNQNPFEFEAIKKISYKLDMHNCWFLSKGRVGENALVALKTQNDYQIMYKATLKCFTNANDGQEAKFEYIQTIKPIKLEVLKNFESVKCFLFNKNGELNKLSLVTPLFEDIYNYLTSEFNYAILHSQSRIFFNDAFSRFSESRNAKYHHKLSHDSRTKHEIYKEIIMNNLEKDNKTSDFQSYWDFREVSEYPALNSNLNAATSIGALLKSSHKMKSQDRSNKIKAILEKYHVSYKVEELADEAIAYYKPFHKYENKYGIYFNLCRFTACLIAFYEKFYSTKNEFYAVRKAVLKKALQHQRFHYLVELDITMKELEISQRKQMLGTRVSSLPCYNDPNHLTPIKRVGFGDLYDKHVAGYDSSYEIGSCSEETLANYFALRYIELNEDWECYHIASCFVATQRRDYAEALKLFNTENSTITANPDDYYRKMELWSNSSYSNHNTITDISVRYEQLYMDRFPLASFETSGHLNIPIFIENDEGLALDDFNELISLVFPGVCPITDSFYSERIQGLKEPKLWEIGSTYFEKIIKIYAYQQEPLKIFGENELKVDIWIGILSDGTHIISAPKKARTAYLSNDVIQRNIMVDAQGKAKPILRILDDKDANIKLDKYYHDHVVRNQREAEFKIVLIEKGKLVYEWAKSYGNLKALPDGIIKSLIHISAEVQSS